MTTNYAVAPGEYLAEWIDEQALSQGAVADLLGMSRKHVNEIVNGHATISPDSAVKLGRATGIPADAWPRYEPHYRADLARLASEHSLASHANAIHPSAASYLRKIGATTSTRRDPGRLVSDFLTFHRCGTWESYLSLSDAQTTGAYALATLTEASSPVETTLLTTWLRAGEMTEAFERGRHYTFDADQLRALLPEVRARAASPDEDMLHDIASLLAKAGTVFLALEPPTSLPLFGVTRWIDNQVPVIQQSGRRRSDGFIIWTLVHEIGHVLNDPRGETHLEFSTEKKRANAAEKAANQFALQTLFGADGINRLNGLQTDQEIRAAAQELGISPGVAVHQMHRRRMLDYSYGNRLLVELSSTLTA